MMRIERAATVVGATPADIPGLWNARGYPELTTGQLLHIAGRIEAERSITAYEVAETLLNRGAAS